MSVSKFLNTTGNNLVASFAFRKYRPGNRLANSIFAGDRAGSRSVVARIILSAGGFCELLVFILFWRLLCRVAKRLVIALILFSMVLHSASRLGLISYLYQQRHEIAYNIGLIAEVPIAMCSSDYDFSNKLVIHEQKATDSTVPPTLAHAPEIHLFFQRLAHFDMNAVGQELRIAHQSIVRDNGYPSPTLSIFHPPS